jgi:N6-L-threonylcarbamoyladenine synthase
MSDVFKIDTAEASKVEIPQQEVQTFNLVPADWVGLYKVLPDFDFSFSGLKTAILYFLRKELAINPNFIQEHLPDLCASIQYSIVKQLLKKFKAAAIHFNINQLALAGGVSANSALRDALISLCEKEKWHAFIPAFEYCTDNAGMVAKTADLMYLDSKFESMDCSPFARL